MHVDDTLQSTAKALGDPSRFRLFRHIADAGDAVTVAELTELLGFNHNAIRQHLAVLVEAGLVAEFDEQRTTRGRPRKLYRPRADGLDPMAAMQGSYRRLSELLLAVVASDDSPFDVGYRAGLADEVLPGWLGDDGDGDVAALLRTLVLALAADGFEPTEHAGEVTLGKCPFADVAAQGQGVVCDLHRGLLAGLADRVAGPAEQPGQRIELQVRDPHAAGCIVRLV